MILTNCAACAAPLAQAELSMMRRLGAGEDDMLVAKGNLAVTYRELGRIEQAFSMRQEVYARRLKLSGEEHDETIREALCLAHVLVDSSRFEDARALMRKFLPVVRRVLGASHDYTLKIRTAYGEAVYMDAAATLDDLREAVTTLEDAERIARRVLGGAHPTVAEVERGLIALRTMLRAREAGKTVVFVRPK